MKKTYGHIQRERELNAAVRIELRKSGMPAGRDDNYTEHIERAWELDGPEWEWGNGESDGAMTVWVYIPKSEKLFNARVFIADFNSKAAAYAYARCRCWLQAKQAEREAADGNA